MSSSSIRMTGMRLNCWSSATPSARVTVSFSSTVVMSPRGRMISRTTVSPNSITDSISACSSTSITESFAAASTMLRNSDSLMKGPSFKLRPGTRRLVILISPFEAMRNGQNAVSAETRGAVIVAPRTEYKTAYVLGTASAKTKNNSTLSTTPITTPGAPKMRLATTPVSVAWRVCKMFTVSSSGFTHLVGSLASRTKSAARRWPSSSSASAFCLVIRDNDISARASNVSTTSKTKMVTSTQTSVLVMRAANISIPA